MSAGLFHALLSQGVSTSFDLLKFSLKYRTTDFSYITSAPYSDTASFPANAPVVRVETAVASDADFCLGAMYLHAEDPANDRIMFRKIVGGNVTIGVWDNDFNVLTDIDNPIGYTFEQGCCIDSLNGRIFSYDYNGGSSVVNVFQLDGTFIEQLTAPAISVSIHWCYDYVNDEFYVSYQGQEQLLQIWTRSGSALVLSETLWYGVQAGVTVDYVFDRIVTFDDNNTHIRQQQRDGTDNIAIYNTPLLGTTSFTEEGLVVAPDGTVYCATPDGFHGGGADGKNRVWHFDPRRIYLKYDRSPSMSRFNKFTGGTVSGDFQTQKINQSVGAKIYSPVYDTNGFTNTENTSAWEFEFSEGGDADITFRVSDTAPTTTPTTHALSDLPVYAGWGSTTPDAEAGTPGTKRYKQAVLTVKEATPSTDITIQDLIDTIQPDILCIMDSSNRMYVYNDETPTNAVTILVNHAEHDNPIENTAFATTFTFSTDKIVGASGDSMALRDASGIAGDTTGHLVVVRKRVATNINDLFLTIFRQGNNSRLRLRHNGTAPGGGAPASAIVIEQTNSSNTVINRVSCADSSMTMNRYDLLSSGTAWSVKINGATQSLTTNIGSNNGNWFGDLGVTVDRFSLGVEGESRLILYKTTELTSEMSDLLDDYITQENLLA